MGSSDSHDAFTGPAENAPKHDDAFTQPNKDAPTGYDPFTQIFKDQIADHWSKKCDHEFKLMKKFMDGFGDKFDDLDFLNYETGKLIKGAELRSCQTGCEMLQVRGWHNSGIRCGNKDLQCGCKQFDEQLQFLNEEDKPLSNMDYCISRADGMKVKGTTDNEGKTKRIKNTQQEMQIEKRNVRRSVPKPE